MPVLASRWFPFVSLFGEAGTSCIHLTVSPGCSLPCVLMLFSDPRNVIDFSVCSAFHLLGWSGNFFFFLIYFNWRPITLQYCGGFCHTFTWISHGCTCVPHPDPPSPSHPSGSSQCTSPEHPVSCIKPGLVIYFTYDNIHVSMLFSQIIPPSPSPTESKSLLFTCVSFAVLHIGSLLPSF